MLPLVVFSALEIIINVIPVNMKATGALVLAKYVLQIVYIDILRLNRNLKISALNEYLKGIAQTFALKNEIIFLIIGSRV